MPHVYLSTVTVKQHETVSADKTAAHLTHTFTVCDHITLKKAQIYSQKHLKCFLVRN